MKFYRSREGALTDDDVKTQLTTLGSQSAPGPLLVPGSASHLVGAYVSGVSSNEAAGQYALMYRLEGPGLPGEILNFVGGAGGTAVATGGHAAVASQYIPLNVQVTPNQEILVFAEGLGADMGTYQAGITLVFADSAADTGDVKGMFTVEGDLTAVDTVVSLTTQGSVTAPSRLVPADANQLHRLIVAVASDAAADGEANYLIRLRGDAIRGGEATLIVGAESFIDVQSGADAGFAILKPHIFDDLDIEVAPNETLDIDAEMVGVDVGTATIAVTPIFT